MNKIKILVRKYFENPIPTFLQVRFFEWFTQKNDRQEKDGAMEELWNELEASPDIYLIEDLNKLHRRIDKSKRRLRANILFAACILPFVIGLLIYYLPSKRAQYTSELIEYSTGYGEQKQFILSDGTEVTLNSGSILILNQKFEKNSRTLFLYGEAFFKVSKDSDRPFTVRTKYLDLTALGTEFNIQSYTDLDRMEIALTEGSLLVNTKNNNQSITLLPNQYAVFNVTTNRLEKIEGEEDFIRWKEGYLCFSEASFVTIIKTIERKFDVTIQYESGKYSNKYYSLKFTPDESLNEILDILKEIIPNLKYKIKEKTVFIY